MGEPIWPTKRPDGTVSVVARFAVRDSGAIDVIRQTIDSWLSVKANQGLDIGDDLVTAPYTESPDATHVAVVFDGTATSRRWKDWLVELTRELTTASDAIVLEGFEDRVSGCVRPG